MSSLNLFRFLLRSDSVHNLDRVLVKVNVGYFVNSYKRFSSESKHRKRFYKDVSVINSDDLYEICLDGKRIKTPFNKLVQVKSQQLALMVANEWKCQLDTIKSYEMHLTNLTNCAIDNPENHTKETLANSILEFLATDTICFRLREPVDLYKLQITRWDPMIDWLSTRYNCQVPLTEDVFLPPIPPVTQSTLHRHLLSYNQWSLHGIYSITESLKSVILTLALIDKKISVNEAVSLSRLELEYQTSIWGNVEWAHTIELMMTRARVSAALLFVFTNSESFKSITKSKTSSY
ncbi:ATP synthase mitochondrial F1 complex assembly factor 2-like [Panonychus citri]|uniref:ATP synthase mitochondrial F1 complex assembly factor 2-like n=1 Tax=Panonychus citri TaxID=50023 RepID=UPI002307321E|nr:ATP synthase mitochondrial F1 complex assembly factor 2-like [Panonychus citri]